MTIRSPGNAVRSPHGAATAPFRVEMLLEGGADGEDTAMRASLDPGTIANRHSHPRGQPLYVLSGKGLARRDGGHVETLRTGDVVWLGAGEKHWHGAAGDCPFSYLSIQAAEAGRFVGWLEPLEVSP